MLRKLEQSGISGKTCSQHPAQTAKHTRLRWGVWARISAFDNCSTPVCDAGCSRLGADGGSEVQGVKVTPWNIWFSLHRGNPSGCIGLCWGKGWLLRWLLRGFYYAGDWTQGLKHGRWMLYHGAASLVLAFFVVVFVSCVLPQSMGWGSMEMRGVMGDWYPGSCCECVWNGCLRGLTMDPEMNHSLCMRAILDHRNECLSSPWDTDLKLH